MNRVEADEDGERKRLSVRLKGEEEGQFPEVESVFDDDVFEESPQRTSLESVEQRAEKDAAAVPSGEVVPIDGPRE